MKVLFRVLKGVLMIPVLVVELFLLYELVGLVVNHAASTWQTTELVRLLEWGLPQVEVIDCYTETGNTAGTGNHVDMLSAVIFRTEAGLEDVEAVLQSYDELSDWYFWVKSMAEVQTDRENYPGVYPYLLEMKIPEELEGCWLLYRNTSAPFPDNIEGH